jgi:hypothetical protein
VEMAPAIRPPQPVSGPVTASASATNSQLAGTEPAHVSTRDAGERIARLHRGLLEQRNVIGPVPAQPPRDAEPGDGRSTGRFERSGGRLQRSTRCSGVVDQQHAFPRDHRSNRIGHREPSDVERCGAPGHVQQRAGVWLQALCDKHGEQTAQGAQ